jgi:hypothetical protein
VFEFKGSLESEMKKVMRSRGFSFLITLNIVSKLYMFDQNQQEKTGMIEIIITPTPVGKSVLYEFPGKKGRRKLVETYESVALSERLGVFHFAVTRDSSAYLFGRIEDRFQNDGECPATLIHDPYLARVSEHSTKAYCLRLFQSFDGIKERLMGAGRVRSHIMIHAGPSASYGCLIIAGGKRGHYRFQKWFEAALSGESEHEIQVTIWPRNILGTPAKP